MDVDEDDDFYAPEDSAPANTQQKPEDAPQLDVKPEQEDEDLEEGEEEDEAVEENSDSVCRVLGNASQDYD
jgi:pre-mRNA 3'-end-processing factor FIP1